ncbi:hypothetical protein [Microlunatus ginsengisoli]|uniref:GerMN domain-containing protein n=1 Tax=Microlunatus ginsengisoli TaxID=363863 RepID=A0ABP7A750_9ACTN
MSASKPWAGAILVAVLTCVVGCSGPAPDEGASSPAPASATGSAGPASATAPGSPSPGSADATAGDAALGSVVATRTVSYHRSKVQLTLYQVRRAGSLSSIDLTLTSPDENTVAAQLLSDDDSSSSARSPFVADGIRLVDGTGKKLYLVAADSAGHCVCTSLLGVNLDPEVPFVVSASFAVLPPTITSVDVQIPNFGTFRDVPIG